MKIKLKTVLIAILLSAINFKTWAQAYSYMGSYNQLGVPNYLVGRDIVDATFLQRMAASLPEGYPVPNYNPHYIASGASTIIELREEADVWVTFVAEGAGYKNTLGYYTYPIDNPPLTVPSNSELTIIFPNVSAAGSGGGLIAGDKVFLGHFEAGTAVAWVLLANAWTDDHVGNGLWKLFSTINFNPESNPNLRYHNVLLNDYLTNRVVLGFEDIRRDFSSCDNDFNDAIFYVTASPSRAIVLDNVSETSEVFYAVSSGVDGGLESDGTLAEKIAQRNVKRELLSPKINYNDPKNLKKLNTKTLSTALGLLAPAVGPDSSVAFISTPEDLVDITNAVDVFSIDYFKNNDRKAVCLITETESSVYQHTKNICDRVGGSSLEAVKTIKIFGVYPANLMTIRKLDGGIEYAISFSFQRGNDNAYIYNSHWNTSNFPEHFGYFNIQLWGAMPSDVYYLAEQVILNFSSIYFIREGANFTPAPSIIMQNGEYSQGKITMQIKNTRRLTGQLKVTGSYRSTESGTSQNFEQSVYLTGDRQQVITINQNGIFDAGMNLQMVNDSVPDAIYFADGAWVGNYELAGVENLKLNIWPHDKLNESTAANYWIERGIHASGMVSNYYSAHRPLKLGLRPVDISNYTYLNFTANGNTDLEIVLSKASTPHWHEQARVWISTNSITQTISIPLSDFKDIHGNSIDLTDIQAITFSVVNNDRTKSRSFDFDINQLAFSSNGPCDQMFIVKTSGYANEKYQSISHLKVENKNMEQAKVILTAGQSIELLPGFETYTGANLKAEIKNCEN